jgi:methionyl-tRNA synthetase
LEKTESELADGKCPIHPNLELEIIDEENYFFSYSKYQKALLDFYGKNKDFVVPGTRFNEIKEFTKNGLEDFSISRLAEKMPWGVPVPDDEKHVMYVWFDALVNYISCLGWPEDNKKFKEFWPGLQVAGKDNLRQQSSMWQAMLLSAGLPLSKQIFIHGFITANGQKMSKSLGNVIDPFGLVEKYGTDAVRYYLLREISPAEDGDFTYEKFEQRYNADLASGLGNLVSRVVTLAAKFGAKPKKIGSEFKKAIRECEGGIEKAMDDFKFNDAPKSIWDLISYCDKHINEKKPWENKSDSKEVISELLSVLLEIAGLLLPFMPETSEKIKRIVGNLKTESLFPKI